MSCIQTLQSNISCEDRRPPVSGRYCAKQERFAEGDAVKPGARALQASELGWELANRLDWAEEVVRWLFRLAAVVAALRWRDWVTVTCVDADAGGAGKWRTDRVVVRW